MQDPDLIQTIFSLAVLVFSVAAHEASHGFMAQYLGDPTARLAGRLTMNPIKHLDPIGSVLVPIVMVVSHSPFIFGWAKPVPYNPYNLRDQKWGSAKVALAGPFMNLAIALFFGVLLRFGGNLFTSSMQTLMHTIVWINVGLTIFNLVPIPPLDGSKLLLSIIPYRHRYLGDYLERYSLVFFLVFLIFLWPFISPLVTVLYRIIVGGF